MLKKLNYIWRLIATGISFTVFGLGGLIMSLTVFPYLNIRYKNTKIRKQKARYIIHKSFGFFIQMMQALQIFTFYLDSAKRSLTETKGKILIANHPSLIDVVVMISILPQADCIVKKALWNNIFLKGVVKAADYIKNDDDVDSLMEACNRSLQEGYCLIIFPEGTRTTPSEGFKLQRGASNIALRCKRDFLPLTIRCVPTTLTKSEKWYQIPERRVDFKVEVGDVIVTKKYATELGGPSIAARRLTADIKQHFEREAQSYAEA